GGLGRLRDVARAAATVATVTVLQAARALGLSRATVQRDVRSGCHGIVRPGEPGRGRGALLDLDAYRRWRSGQADDERVLRVAAQTALRTWQSYGSPNARMRGHSAALLALYVSSFYRALTGRDLVELPAECVTLLG